MTQLTTTTAQVRPYLAGNDYCPLRLREYQGIGGYLSNLPEHFVVHERALFLPDGSGEHTYILLQKKGDTTTYAINALSKALGISPRDIGYAGRKDRHAITTQWMSVPVEVPESIVLPDSMSVLVARRHSRKLKLGNLKGNRFNIYLSDITQDDQLLYQHIEALNNGVPNYFGRQRFGKLFSTVASEDDPQVNHMKDNVDRALDLLHRPKQRVRDPKMLLSALQSALFNLWVGERISDGLFSQVIEGDVCRKIGGGTFTSDNPIEDSQRLKRGEIDILGPLVGKKMFPTKGYAKEREEALFHRWGIDEALRSILPKFWRGERRVMSIRPEKLTWNRSDGGIWLNFSLPKGAYATTLLTELYQGEEPFERRRSVPD